MTGTAELRAMREALAASVPARDAATCADQLRALEEIKAAASAAQARVAVALADAARRANVDAGVPVARADLGVASQIGLALRTSPFRGQRFLGWARILTSELPHTFAELAAGRTTQWRTMLVARETAWLSREHRADVDTQVAARLERWSDRRVEAETARTAYRLDPAGAAAKAANAVADRNVTVRPAPDTMTRFSALLPVVDGVAAQVALQQVADSLIATGEAGGRTRMQIMADTLVDRVTGRAQAGGVGVEVALLMTDIALLAPPGTPGRDEPAQLQGHGPVPAAWARDVVLRGGGPRWLRRVFRAPTTAGLAAMETRRRYFTANQARFVRLRDQTCATPWCDAPIRHIDHVTPAIDGGSTSVSNASGLCETCNHAKQAPGWRSERHPDGDATVTTPAGRSYRSRAPDPPGCPTEVLLRSPITWPPIEVTWFGHAA